MAAGRRVYVLALLLAIERAEMTSAPPPAIGLRRRAELCDAVRGPCERRRGGAAVENLAAAVVVLPHAPP